MKKCNYLLLLCLGMFFSCQSGNKNVSVLQLDNSSIVVCDESKVSEQRNVPLSELVDDYQLIRFDNDEAAYFKLQWMAFSDNYISIWQRDGGPVKLFRKSGEFICNVGEVGQGPGEYRSLYDVLIDEKNNSIYLAPFVGESILKYNLAGEFQKEINVGARLQKPRLFLNPDSSLSLVQLCFKDRGDKFVAANVQIANTDSIKYTYVDELASNFVDKEKQENVGFNDEIWSYRNAENFPFMFVSTDTLYHYDSMQNEVKACFTLVMDKEKRKGNFFIFNELPRYYWAFIVGNNGKAVMVDKSTHEAFQPEIINDYLGDLVMFPRFQDGYFFDTCEPMVLKDKLEKHIAAGKCPEGQLDKLKEFISTLNENDNNILFIGKLKK